MRKLEEEVVSLNRWQTGLIWMLAFTLFLSNCRDERLSSRIDSLQCPTQEEVQDDD